jgi:hypothetical protein
MRPILIVVLAIAITGSSFSQTTKKPNKNPMSTDSRYPFQALESNGQYSIVAQIETADLFDKYNPLFEKYGYSGNGYCWEGHITQILEKVDKELLKHIEFDPEAGAFYAYADTKNAQSKFITVLSPIFSDLKKLEEYIKTADRDRIDD